MIIDATIEDLIRRRSDTWKERRGAGKSAPRSLRQLPRRVLEFVIDPQLDAARSQQQKPSLGLSGPDQVADPKLPLPEPRSFRPGQRVFYAFVIHGNLPLPSAVTGVELRSSAVSWAGNTCAARRVRRKMLSLQVFQPHGRV